MSYEFTTGLISADALARRLGDPNLVVLDTRTVADGGLAAFEWAHIPGSVHTDYAGDGWRARVGDAPGMLPASDHLAALAGRLGIRPGSEVVIVPSGGSATDLAAATRVYWTIKIMGHGQQVVLDGGFAGWRADPKQPVESGPSRQAATDPYPVVIQQHLRSTADATFVALRGRQANLVDARTRRFFEGEEKSAEAARAGRIPGAILRNSAEAFDTATGRLKPVEELAALYAGVPNGPVVSYCNTGHSAALGWFVMSEVLGRDEITLYDGSMTDWTQAPERPVETGPA